MGDKITTLTLRHMEPLTSEDIQRLQDFGQEHDISWWLQPKGPETAHPLLREDADKLAYALPEFDLRMPYRPTDFTQVNHDINRSLISRALTLLDVKPEHRVADLFCGLGNFSLPLARRAAEVVGIEGSSTLTERDGEAALAHDLQDKAKFTTLNLFEVDVQWLRDLGHFDRMLIDPPRDGARPHQPEPPRPRRRAVGPVAFPATGFHQRHVRRRDAVAGVPAAVIARRGRELDRVPRSHGLVVRPNRQLVRDDVDARNAHGELDLLVHAHRHRSAVPG